MRYNYMPIRMAKTQNTDDKKKKLVYKMWSNRNSSSLLVRMQTGTATLEDGLAVSYKTKQTLIMQSKICALWYLPKEVKNVCLHKNQHMMFRQLYS
jgi:hypothetical protein